MQLRQLEAKGYIVAQHGEKNFVYKTKASVISGPDSQRVIGRWVANAAVVRDNFPFSPLETRTLG